MYGYLQQGRDLAALETGVHELEQRVASLESSSRDAGRADGS